MSCAVNRIAAYFDNWSNRVKWCVVFHIVRCNRTRHISPKFCTGNDFPRHISLNFCTRYCFLSFCFLFKHWSMNQVLPFLVCGACSEDSLLSGRFQHWSLIGQEERDTETKNGVESFSGVVNRDTLNLQKSQNRVAARLLQLRYYHPQGSEETSGELRWISCYCHAWIV